MGFGSYDESEQENQQGEIETEEDEIITTESYDGEETVEAESADELLETYKQNKGN